MIDPEELRRFMELQGHDPETISEVMAWYDTTPLDRGATVAVLNLLAAEIAKAAESLSELWEGIQGVLFTPTEKPLRPPRYAGPKNKAATRVERPARVARSSCRKIHKYNNTGGTAPPVIFLKIFSIF